MRNFHHYFTKYLYFFMPLQIDTMTTIQPCPSQVTVTSGMAVGAEGCNLA